MTTQQQIKPIRGEEFPRSFTKSVTDFGNWQELAKTVYNLMMSSENKDV